MGEGEHSCVSVDVSSRFRVILIMYTMNDVADICVCVLSWCGQVVEKLVEDDAANGRYFYEVPSASVAPDYL